MNNLYNDVIDDSLKVPSARDLTFSMTDLYLGPVANSGGRRDWAGPGLARRFETTQRRSIADV